MGGAEKCKRDHKVRKLTVRSEVVRTYYKGKLSGEILIQKRAFRCADYE